MDKLREAGKQAAEALGEALQMLLPKDQRDKARQAFWALNSALAEPVADEPVAVKRHDPHCHMVGPNDGGREWIEELAPIAVGTKLYTHPAAQGPVANEPVGYTCAGMLRQVQEHREGWAGRPDCFFARAKPQGDYTVALYTRPAATERAYVDADRAQRVPLNIEAINAAWEARTNPDYLTCFYSFAAGVSLAESEHGIGAKP